MFFCLGERVLPVISELFPTRRVLLRSRRHTNRKLRTHEQAQGRGTIHQQQDKTVIKNEEEGGVGRGARGGAGSKVNPSPRALIWPPTFSDADQLMNSTVTLATWKDNAVSMSHVVMEGNARGEETNAMETRLHRTRTRRRTNGRGRHTYRRRWQTLHGTVSGRSAQKCCFLLTNTENQDFFSPL